ncbi:ATP-binding cassette domain-containing protein [Streptococcus caprae]|uniref:ATP-binding cassette domain-containing protein n=1 Tax=Streptococcus caprae TaxID=1640501 RepID=A0ABV8CUT9_9STRE
MLQTKHLSIHHLKDLHPLITDLSISINHGDKVAIIGEEGTGKSTLLKHLYKPELIQSYTAVEGEVIRQFQAPAYLPQAIAEQDLDLTLSDFIYKDIDYAIFDFNQLYQLAGTLNFEASRLDNTKQTVRQLSGGEKIKIQLLKLLAQNPDILFLDKPSSNLDLESVTWLKGFIKTTPLTLVYISHDEDLLGATATHIIHLEQVKKRREAKTTSSAMSYQTYKETREATYIRQGQLANKEREKQAKRTDKLNRQMSAVRHQLEDTKNSTAGRLLAKKYRTLQAQEKRFEREAESFHAIPDELDQVNLFFQEVQPLPASSTLIHYDHEVLVTGQNLSFTMRGQDKVAVIGQNGIGKSLLLKKILKDLSRKPKISLGYMPQNYEDSLVMTETPLQFLAHSASQEIIRTTLASLQFTRQEITHTIADLSGGQKAKLFLCKMVLEKNNVLLLDEPTRHFSPTSQPEIRKLLKDFPGAILTVSHDRTFINSLCQHVYELNKSTLLQIDIEDLLN